MKLGSADTVVEGQQNVIEPLREHSIQLGILKQEISVSEI